MQNRDSTKSYTDNENPVQSKLFNSLIISRIFICIVVAFCLFFLAVFTLKYVNFFKNKDLIYCEIPQLIVSVRSGRENFKTVKIRLSLSIEGENAAKRLNHNLPGLQNAFTLFLSSLRIFDLESAGFAAKLRNELHKRTDALFPGLVRSTLIRELLVE